MSDTERIATITEALRAQGAAYPKAGAELIIKALTDAGIELVELPEPTDELEWEDPDGVWTVWNRAGRDYVATRMKSSPVSVNDARAYAAALLAAAKAADRPPPPLGGLPEPAHEWHDDIQARHP